MKKTILLLALSFTLHFSNNAYAQSGNYFSRSLLVIFENTDYKDVMKEDFFLQLAQTGANFTDIKAIIHPSQGNYVALTSGSRNGVFSDRVRDIDARNIVDLLEAKNISWKVYAEDYPGNCFTGKSYKNYVRKHNPFISYLNIQKNSERCSHIVNANQFMEDQKNNNLPEFMFYIPDMDNDAHDTDIHFANNWYKSKFQELFSNAEFLQDTIIITTFDESSHFNFGNQIYTSIIGSNILPGNYSEKLSLYSLLKLFEENWDLGHLTNNDRDANSVPNIWK